MPGIVAPSTITSDSMRSALGRMMTPLVDSLVENTGAGKFSRVVTDSESDIDCIVIEIVQSVGDDHPCGQ